ncbi:DUF3658 domain-containing protein [Vallitalea guaymasensis]|uniref:DUF1835 domain-containing protein n=1 Tax=Vallitalea guaymasensis TaxID=1185412 RepID=A0A8J8SAY1_9FIRM|nr:DUF3658 domain-containing protein [Vallitalea guaymasensis]QUH28147.1 DUF1835 domain-containing protein [Vallitalea guaymasensis]
MIEVCFSDSEKGCLKVAQKEGKGLGNNSKDVVAIFGLDMLEIKSGVVSKKRKKLLFDMFKSPFDDIKNFDIWWEKYVKDLNILIDSAQRGEDIRIWYSNAPCSICGLYFVMAQIENFQCRVTGIKLPAIVQNDNGKIIEYLSWGELRAEKFCEFLHLESEISQIERQLMVAKWRKLEDENATLRVVINGKLTSVPSDFYDYYIRKEIPDDQFIMGHLIGNVLGKYQFGIGDDWIAKRIENMISRGELHVVKDNELGYRRILKK